MIITDIQPQVKRKGRSSVFIDGEFSFGIDNVDLILYHLKIGKEISNEEFDRIITNCLLEKAKSKVARLVSFSAKTEKEIKTRLKEEYSDEIIEKVISLYKKYGYINDEEYAKKYISDSFKLKGDGPNKIRYNLRTKGIKDEYIDNALCDDSFDWHSLCLKVLNKKLKGKVPADYKEKSKIYNFLATRGFSFDTIKEVLEDYLSENRK